MDERRGIPRPEIRWAPRVRPELIRRLYAADARGILDEELLADVGYGLYARCRSILKATAAHGGRVECPGCGRIIPHGWDRQEILRCEPCAWEMTWGAYRGTFHGRNLLAGGAAEAFADYVECFERADTPRARMLAIDRLIHAFHRDARGNPSSPAARNVVEANIGQVIALLDSLAYGDASTPGVDETLAVYRETLSGTKLRRAGQGE